MFDYQEERPRRAAPRRPDGPGADERLTERALGEPTAPPAPARPSLLQRQQGHNIIWRWHVRRRHPRP